ncbi:class I SAM-dependent methyltransferase [Umezawaea endophytica]|uniref:Class I SAM-dependent methyltransferase n=1 Tax=Umezawaea endophytica TaxID=1654476 RepID=A0A9X2VU60_9PSEU|nr:class I SAM-dependent methyltransferase [Umezawaea endophytica]MCS7482689.1 class I SAM-dependent methyltransferase [Umezawaea endophytica]
MTQSNREDLRHTFGEDPERYDRIRPTYPPELFTDLAPGPRVLEIGPGTGQATLPLARLGRAVTAVELSPTMAAVAARNLADHPNAEVVVAAFEDWPLPPEPFDLVLSATAFHWIDPAVRMRKSADALRPGGALAVISTHHVLGGTTRLFVDVQRCYERFDPDTPPNLRQQEASDIPRDTAEFDASGRFTPVTFHDYVWEQTYSRDQYLDLLLTYSNHRALRPDRQAGLLRCIGDMIDSHGGSITKRYLTQMAVARTKQAP